MPECELAPPVVWLQSSFPVVSASQDEAERSRTRWRRQELSSLPSVVPRDENVRRNKVRAPRVKQVNTNQMASLCLALLSWFVPTGINTWQDCSDWGAHFSFISLALLNTGEKRDSALTHNWDPVWWQNVYRLEIKIIAQLSSLTVLDFSTLSFRLWYENISTFCHQDLAEFLTNLCLFTIIIWVFTQTFIIASKYCVNTQYSHYQHIKGQHYITVWG